MRLLLFFSIFATAFAVSTVATASSQAKIAPQCMIKYDYNTKSYSVTAGDKEVANLEEATTVDVQIAELSDIVKDGLCAPFEMCDFRIFGHSIGSATSIADYLVTSGPDSTIIDSVKVETKNDDMSKSYEEQEADLLKPTRDALVSKGVCKKTQVLN